MSKTIRYRDPYNPEARRRRAGPMRRRKRDLEAEEAEEAMDEARHPLVVDTGKRIDGLFSWDEDDS